ncbi:MAG TPA: CPBP family intramembrane glutamic endopeptidase, partial [Thermoanaerobaculia bacterium]|nr:CPBP family intramembrane glutamic endopeptidase [Thermoanaerobaculia bacterium]
MALVFAALHGWNRGITLLAFADALIETSSGLRHARGGGFPWRELLIVFVPAALHEELLFRGYPFQKLLARHRGAAYGVMALVFAALHGWNRGITPLALVNLVLAGAMLGLAYELRRSLWVPIGLHLAWNVVSGPILGYPISGYIASSSLLAVRSPGAEALSGGAFGIEGSAWATVVEVAAIAILAWISCRQHRAKT